MNGVTPGKGVHPDIDLNRRREDTARRHPMMAAASRHATRGERAFVRLPAYEIGEAPPQIPVQRTLPDEEIELGARIVGMRDPNPEPRHREGPPVRKLDALKAAIARVVKR